MVWMVIMIAEHSCKAVIDALKASFDLAMTTPVRVNVRLSEAPGHHQSIFDYASHPAGAEDF